MYQRVQKIVFRWQLKNWEMELSRSSVRKTISIHMPNKSQVGFPLSSLRLLSLSSNCFLPLSLSAPNHRNLPKFKSVLSLHCHSAVTSLHPFRHPNWDVDCPLPFIPSRSFHLRKHLIFKHHSFHHHHHHQCLAPGGSLHVGRTSFVKLLPHKHVPPAEVKAPTITSVQNKTFALSNICHSLLLSYSISLSWH